MNISHDASDQPTGPATDPTEQHAPTAPPPPLPPTTESARFFQWIRGLGIQRGSERWVGGVCSGLGNKWGIDPIIVRGLAVVLTLFFGVGLLAYGVAWALLPEPDGRIHVEEVGRGRWTSGMTGAAIVTLLGMVGPGRGFVFGVDHDGFPWPLLGLAIVGWIIYRAMNRGKVSQASQQAPAEAGPAPAAFATPPPFTPDPRMYVKQTPVVVIPRFGAAATLLTLGLAAIVGSAVLLLDSANVWDLHGYQAGVAMAAAALTAGAGIIFSGIRGRAAGGLGTFAVIALVLASLFSLPVHTSNLDTFNESSWQPGSISVAEAGRTVVLGNSMIDLTKFDDGTPLTSDVRVPLNVVAANITVKVPSSIPVRIQSELAAASLTVDGENDGQVLAEESTTELNPTASGNGLIIVLQGAASSIDIVTAP
ncbi:hypothetical protein CVS30_02095 [Arthrobacter psychrolactophilus]|uniref:Phage shock protein PspC N-terminal domain-containing protein n=1 Tax=Arthrobacter psychrolactophilus TaxID=92442 RepID=A0A2V5JJ10_9MICC|nr:PspC domain-containing protein [Arthrobacter psychrolactophilus]PYI40327.1 hypothetical protein CVS30_02095 [Arthrobacter psychrolactophilus]